MHETVELTAMPAAMGWAVAPVAWSLEGDTLAITSGAQSDMFCSPDGSAPSLDAARLLCPASGDFLLSARVGVEFAATFDAGALLVWHDDAHWGKLCFEYSPDREPMVVSVVTRGRSDDANAFTHHGAAIWLRIARLGPALAFHASTDGRRWQLVRHFTLELDDTAQIGFVSQSPTGQGVVARFDHISFSQQRLAELRSGE